MFNPQEPRSLSSRCHKGNIVNSISSYLKTQVVGLNDNSNMVITAISMIRLLLAQ
jgi:hypothetical protein